MDDLSKKTICFVDNGLFVSFARKVAPAFAKAYYYRPFQNAFVRTVDISVGVGLPELEVVLQPLAIADDVNLWCFLDLYNSGLQLFLEKHGAKVWGARNGEELELERWSFKKHLKRIGLPVQPMEHLIGLDELVKFLKTSENKYVKTSFVRGDFETFHHVNWTLSEPRVDELRHVIGPTSSKYEFIVEDAIDDSVEVGFDGFSVDGKFPNVSMTAYEIKDVGMIGAAKPLGQPLKSVNTHLADTLAKYQYRGFLSTEIRYGKDRKAYLVDPCCRLGAPSNELLQELFTDWPQTLWDGSIGVVNNQKVIAKYGVLTTICSEWAVNNWQSVHFPKVLDQWVKLRFHARYNDKDYVVPQTTGVPEIGCVVGVGNTVAEAIKIVKERAKQIQGYGIEVKTDSLDKALKVIEEGQKLGIEF